MEKVKILSRVFNAEIPLPVIKSPPPGVHRRGDGPNIKYIEKRVPVFDPEKDATACFKIFMEDLNEIILKVKNFFSKSFRIFLKGKISSSINVNNV